MTELRTKLEKASTTLADMEAKQGPFVQTTEEVSGLHKQLEKAHQRLAQAREDLTATQQDLTATQQDLTATQQDLTATQQDLTATRQKLEQAPVAAPPCDSSVVDSERQFELEAELVKLAQNLSEMEAEHARVVKVLTLNPKP